jgi:hypothetical protein
MPAKRVKSTNTHQSRTDQRLETSLVFLKNYTIFLKTISDKTPEAIPKETFGKLSLAVDSFHGRLSSYRRRRSSQITTDLEYPVPPHHYRLWQALRKHYIFQKPAIGKAYALRVVSTSEAMDKALQYSLLGIACFRICTEASPKALRKLASAIETKLTDIAGELLDLASPSR